MKDSGEGKGVGDGEKERTTGGWGEERGIRLLAYERAGWNGGVTV